jgi:protein-S-isoprenylcysteine O-methyltransferase Ste14
MDSKALLSLRLVDRGMKVDAKNGRRSLWVAWAVSVGELALIVGAGLLFSRYWLMLPVWMRWCGASILVLAILVVLVRLRQFHRSRKMDGVKSAPSGGV